VQKFAMGQQSFTTFQCIRDNFAALAATADIPSTIAADG
jgi:hypothetical protein